MRSLFHQLFWNITYHKGADIPDSVFVASVVALMVIGVAGLLAILGLYAWNPWVGGAAIVFLIYKLFRYALHKDVEE